MCRVFDACRSRRNVSSMTAAGEATCSMRCDLRGTMCSMRAAGAAMCLPCEPPAKLHVPCVATCVGPCVPCVPQTWQRVFNASHRRSKVFHALLHALHRVFDACRRHGKCLACEPRKKQSCSMRCCMRGTVCSMRAAVLATCLPCEPQAKQRVPCVATRIESCVRFFPQAWQVPSMRVAGEETSSLRCCMRGTVCSMRAAAVATCLPCKPQAKQRVPCVATCDVPRVRCVPQAW